MPILSILGAKGDIGWPGPMGVVGIRGIDIIILKVND